MDSTAKTHPDPSSSAHPQHVSLPLTDVNTMDRHVLGVIILVAFTALTCLTGLRSGPTLGDHEAFNALAARDVVQNGNWLIPHPGDEPRVRKTPLGIWAIAGVSKIVQVAGQKPETEFTARLPSALAAMITSMAVYWLGAMLIGHRAGLVAGFVTASCAATLFFARNAQADQLLAMFTTLSFAFFWRGALHASPSRLHMAAFYVCFGLAMMAKAPLPLVTVGLSLAVYWFFTLPLVEALERTALPKGRARRWTEAMSRRFQGLRGLWIVPGILIFLVVAGLWPLYVYFTVDNATELWRTEYFDRYTGQLRGKSHPIWYYVPLLFALTFPFLASLPEAVAAIFLPRYANHRRALGYALTWAVVTTVFLTTAAFKRPHYLASAIPAYCLLLGLVVDRLFFGPLMASSRMVRMVSGALPVLIGILWAVGVWYAQREIPELARTIAVGLGAAAFCWMLSSLAFYGLCRRSSFALLLLGMPLMLALTSPHLGKISLNQEADALSKALIDHNVSKDADIYWTDGRPNAAVEFYTGLRIGRLTDVLDAAAERDGRSKVSPELLLATGERIKDRMNQPKPAYFIMSRDNYDMLGASGNIPHRVAFEVKDASPDPDDALVVFTQPQPTAPETPIVVPDSQGQAPPG
jgi:4-amino-4-deoxy-L-arabinose transferase-like glycosyltransferase